MTQAHPPRKTPPPWKNETIRLYHGTIRRHAESILNHGIDLSVQKPYSDFGKGFYTTTIRDQAESWAYGTSDIRMSSNKIIDIVEDQPVIIEYEISIESLSKLDILFYVIDNDAFWSFVFHCRDVSNPSPHHRRGSKRFYDVVAGPVAIPWRQRKTMKGSDQISFHTEKAIQLLQNPIINDV